MFDIHTTSMQQTANIREKFLNMNYCDLLQVAENNETDVYYIYIIENLKTHKKYVGKAKNIYDRAGAYIRATLKESTYKLRPITKAIVEEGIQNFVMYPIATCNGKYEAGDLEIMYMKIFNTISPNGYNITQYADYNGSHSHRYNHSIETKIKKSKLVVCINVDSKIMFVCVGMKLFGDFIGTTKDAVKNVAKRPCRLHGFYVIYLNDVDRNNMKQCVLDKVEKSYLCGDKVITPQRLQYLDCVKMVDEFIENPQSNAFKDYQQRFITYNTHSNAKQTYVIQPIDEFLKLIK